MLAPWILLALAAILVVASLRRGRHGAPGSAGRTWLRVAAIFVLVSAWLFYIRA